MTIRISRRSVRTKGLLSTLTISGLLASGCASSSVSGVGTHGVVSKPTTATDTATSGDPAALALRDARALLSGFTAPPTAARTSGEPSGTPSEMRHPAFSVDIPTKVNLTEWWVVDATESSAYSWLVAHNPASGSHGSGTVGSMPAIRFLSYSSSSTDQLRYRTVTAEVGPLSATRAVIRLDAEVAYRPVKPRSETVPAAPYLLLTVQPRGDTATAWARPTVTVITDRAKIAAVARLINALPTDFGGVHSCPAFLGPLLTLDFKTVAAAPAPAEVAVDSGGCGTVRVTVGGVRQPNLDPADSSGSEGGLVGHVASILGVPLT